MNSDLSVSDPTYASYSYTPASPQYVNFYQPNSSTPYTYPQTNYPAFYNYTAAYDYSSWAYTNQTQSPAALNGSYHAHDSGYYSSAAATSLAVSQPPTPSSDANDKKRALDNDNNDTSGGGGDDNEVEKERKRPRVHKYNFSSDSARQQTVCSVCHTDFESVARCLMHMHRVHKRQDPTQCPICSKFY